MFIHKTYLKNKFATLFSLGYKKNIELFKNHIFTYDLVTIKNESPSENFIFTNSETITLKYSNIIHKNNYNSRFVNSDWFISTTATFNDSSLFKDGSPSSTSIFTGVKLETSSNIIQIGFSIRNEGL